MPFRSFCPEYLILLANWQQRNVSIVWWTLNHIL